MKTILEKVIENKGGHYIHAIEVESTYELENIVEAMAGEFHEYGVEALKDFFNSMAIYYIGDDAEMEEEVYNFDIIGYIEDNF